MELPAGFNVNLEFATVLQFNRYDQSHRFLPLLPALSLGWKF